MVIHSRAEAKRGEAVRNEERNLAEKVARREAVLQTYRMFDPIEIDTSHLDPGAVLVAVLEVLHKSVLC